MTTFKHVLDTLPWFARPTDDFYWIMDVYFCSTIVLESIALSKLNHKC